MSLKKLIAPAVLGIALLGSLATAGTAGAATPPLSTSTASTPAATHGPGKWLSAHRPQVRRAVLSISATTIGITRQELVGDLRSGQTLAEVATSHGVKTQTVVSALVHAADAKVDKAVTEHRVSAAQGAKIKSKIEGLVTKLVNHHFTK